jgi:hypothetical protein
MKTRVLKPAFGLLALALLVLGAAAETFKFRQVRVPVQGPIHDMIVVDLNRDGYPDIAVIDNANKVIRTFLGSSSYAYPQAFEKRHAKIGKRFIGTGDFNGDKIPDLAADVPWTKAYFAIFPGKGDGSLKNVVNVNSGKSQTYFDFATVLDFNNDGKSDVVGVQIGSGGGPLLSFLNLGNAKFKARTLMSSCDYDSVVPGKFDSDKWNDLVFGELYPDDFLAFYKGKGDGTFLAPKKTTQPALGTCLVAGDLNGDRKLDLVGDGNYWNDAWSLVGTGKGGFIKRKKLPADASFGGGGVLARLDGDAKLDLATGETGGIALFSGNGNGSFTSQGRIASHLRFDRELGALAAADVNKDGRIDLIGAQWNSGVKWNDDSDDMSNLILFLNGQTPNTLTISNLTTTKLSYAVGVISYAGSLQFQSTSGDLKFVSQTEVTDSAYMDFKITLDFPSPQTDYTFHCYASGTFLDKPGQTTGTFSWDMNIPVSVVTTSTPIVMLKDFYLLDYNLVLSNGLLTSALPPGRTARIVRDAPDLGKIIRSGRSNLVTLVGVEAEK